MIISVSGLEQGVCVHQGQLSSSTRCTSHAARREAKPQHIHNSLTPANLFVVPLLEDTFCIHQDRKNDSRRKFPL